MSLDVYFNRPDQTVPIYRLRDDMRSARDRLVLASAWFTDDETAQAFAESRATLRLAIVSRSDLNRPGGSRQAVEILQRAQQKNCVLSIIGTGDWRTGVMHHKFVVADNIVWVGSYNFTYQAKRNYENLMRVASAELAEKFWAEALALTGVKVTMPAPKPVRHDCLTCGQSTHIVNLYDGYCWTCSEARYSQCDTCGGTKEVRYDSNACRCDDYPDACTACQGSGKNDVCRDCGGWIFSLGTGGCWCDPETRELMECEECQPVGAR